MPLSAKKVESAGPGRHADGNGLYLLVAESGRRSWVLRYQMKGRRRDAGLGAYPAVGLADARQRALNARRLIASGLDPLQAKIAEQPRRTFVEVADDLIASLSPGWKNPKHHQQWRNTLASHAGSLRTLDVAAITTEDVLKVLKPIWTQKPETAARLRGRIEAVLEAATARGLRSEANNPARWRGHLQHLLPPRKRLSRGHHRALPYEELPAFMACLQAEKGTSARALEFAILTAARSGEVLGARWTEFDPGKGLWTVPAGRMKAGKEHRVPLCARAMDILAAMGAIRTCEFIFPGRSAKGGLSVMALQMVLRRMGVAERATVHGFRSAFADWASEQTHHTAEVREMALAHAVGNKVEAAYRRGDLFEKRRELMVDWAAYALNASASDVEALHLVEAQA